MKYQLKAYEIYESGKRVDAAGNPHQEDSVFPQFGQPLDDSRLFILCDGMGGHDSGEVASATVCEAMSESILAATTPDGPCPDRVIIKAIGDAYDALDVKDTGAARKMGTTMTMLKLHDQGYTMAHMGDSRIYQIRPGKTPAETKVIFRTRDHSLVNDLIAIGEITEEEAKHARNKNVITRAMQPGQERRSKADFHSSRDIKPGDYFYLCSDGMLEQMSDRELCVYIGNKSLTDEEKVQQLIDATRDNSDNHSAILVHITEVIDPLPVPEVVIGDATAAPMPSPRTAANRHTTSAQRASSPIQPASTTGSARKGGNRWLWIILAAILVIVVFLFFMMLKPKSEKPAKEGDGTELVDDWGDDDTSTQTTTEPNKNNGNKHGPKQHRTPGKTNATHGNAATAGSSTPTSGTSEGSGNKPDAQANPGGGNSSRINEIVGGNNGSNGNGGNNENENKPTLPQIPAPNHPDTGGDQPL